MKASYKFSVRYIKFYKRQTLAILFSIVISVALMTGISSLVYSGERSNLEKDRTVYGDYHYYIKADSELIQEIRSKKKGEEYRITRLGVFEKKKVIQEPYIFSFIYADGEYFSIIKRKLLKGDYPAKPGEVMLDEYTMQNLNISNEIGRIVMLDGKEYTLCGVVSNRWATAVGGMEGFVSKDTKGDGGKQFLYIKFDEEKDLKKQRKAFQKEFHIPDGGMMVNDAVVSFFGDGQPFGFWKLMTTPGSNFTTALMYAQEEFNLTVNGVIIILCIFSSFIIYSIFHVSIMKRTSQYGIMEALGIGDKDIFRLLFMELGLLFAMGYPIGSIIGNGIIGLSYSKFSNVFADADAVSKHFYISYKAVILGAVFLGILLFLISFISVRRLHRLSVVDVMKNSNHSKRRNRKSYSTNTVQMTDVISKKFMFARKGTFISILFSLSLGGIIFLCTTYVTVNTRHNNELSLKADDGLGSDYQIFLETSSLQDTIPEKSVSNIKKVPGVESAHPVNYFLGELEIARDTLQWKNFFPEIANDPNYLPDPRTMEYFNGICTERPDGGYGIKSNIYGYDSRMLAGLESYLLEGRINPLKMQEDNSVILRTLMDGQGYYDGLLIHPGDTITVKVPKSPDVPEEAVKFGDQEDWFLEKKFVVSAVVSRAMANNPYFIGNSGLDLILTNRQMEENFGISGYNIISVKKGTGDSKEIVKGIKDQIYNLPRCLIKDYTAEIKLQNSYLEQKMIFFYGIAVILLMISLMHIMNSMSHLVLSRRHEFGILRAMGITDSGFLIMMLKEGLLYGVFASLLTVLVYLGLERLLLYLLKHVYLYINPNQRTNIWIIGGIIILNLIISVGAVFIPVKQVLGDSIIEEINRE